MKQYLIMVYLIKYLWLGKIMIFPFLWKYYTCRKTFSWSKYLHMLRKCHQQLWVRKALIIITSNSARQTEVWSLSQSADTSLLNDEVAEAEELWMVSVCIAHSLAEEFLFPISLSCCSEKPDSLHHRFLRSKNLKKNVKYLDITGEERGKGRGQGFQLLCVSVEVCLLSNTGKNNVWI